MFFVFAFLSCLFYCAFIGARGEGGHFVCLFGKYWREFLFVVEYFLIYISKENFEAKLFGKHRDEENEQKQLKNTFTLSF